MPSPGDDVFAAVRLTAGAWRTLERTHRILSRVIASFPDGRKHQLGFETLLPPAPGQKPHCAGVAHSLAPPCGHRSDG
jgi:hypothetical protein